MYINNNPPDFPVAAVLDVSITTGMAATPTARGGTAANCQECHPHVGIALSPATEPQSLHVLVSTAEQIQMKRRKRDEQ